MQWKIVYTLATGICTAVNSRDPQEGEGVLNLNPAQCGWVNVYPERYRVVAGTLIERTEWAIEDAFKTKKATDEADARRTFEIESEAPVQALGRTWNGGQDSASYIQGAVNLAQALSEPNVTITDISNVAHTMSFSDALMISAIIGKAFRDAFFKKQAALVEISGRTMQ